MNVLVCVVVYDRIEMISKWLRAWNNAEKYGAKLLVINNYNKDEKKRIEIGEKVRSFHPDYYIEGNNHYLDVGAFEQVIKGNYETPEWDVLCWFTDDMLPMRRTFLKGFIEKFEDPEVGLVSQCYEPKIVAGGGKHIRTVAFAVSKKFADTIVFPAKCSDQRHWCLMFEHGASSYEDNILNLCYKNGFKFKLAHGGEPESDNYQHWTSFLDYMWDASLLGHWKEYWNVYEAQFDPIQIREDLEVHPHMLLSLAECERLTTIPNKVTAVIATSTCPVDCFMWNIFSLLFRSTREVLEHINIVINGPDKRTGDTSIQDLKQKFLEDLREMKWQGHDMPLTVTRTWSRLGHTQSLEQGVAWVHTQNYLAMHDDIIVLSNNWEKEAKNFFEKPQVAALVWERLHPLRGPQSAINFGHMSSAFILCKKPIFTQLNAKWSGYHIPLEYHIGNLANYSMFMEWHKKHRTLTNEADVQPRADKVYSLISMDIGTWAIYNIIRNGYSIESFSKDLVYHFLASSWRNHDCVELPCSHVTNLEQEIKNSPYYDLYKKYSNYKFTSI